MKKIKLNKAQMSEIIKEAISNVLKEDDTLYPEDREFDSGNDFYSEIASDEVDNQSINEVLKSYLETLIWSNSEDLDGKTINDIDSNSIDKSRNDIIKFIELISNTPGAQEEVNTYDEKSFGHNFALSRNGHGAGFFDDWNDILQDLARNFGEADLYLGDDGRLYIMGAENGVNESKRKNKIKLNINELTNIIKSVIKEDEEFSDSLGYDDNSEEEFTPHGAYTVSNSGGFLIMLDDSGDMAKVKDDFGSDNPEISDWLPIEYVQSEDEFDEDGNPEMEPVIDPNGYNIPLNMVMRINESKKSKKKKLNESDDLLEFDIPEWAVSALINGDYSGLSDEDEQKLNSFTQNVVQKFGNAHFMLGDIEGSDDLGFKMSNDIDNLGSNVYRLYIMPDNITESKKIKITKKELSEMVGRSINKILKEENENGYYINGEVNPEYKLPEKKNYDLKIYEFEVYAKNPETEEGGSEIKIVTVISDNLKNAINIMKKNPLYDEYITGEVVGYLNSEDLTDEERVAATNGIWG